MSLAGMVSKIDRLSKEEREYIEICNEAAEVIEWFADECESHDAEHCQITDGVLRECADSCRRMTA